MEKNAQHEILTSALYEAARAWVNAALEEFKKTHPTEHAEFAVAIAEGRLPFEVTIDSIPPRVRMRLIDREAKRAMTVAIYAWSKFAPVKREDFN